jgi:hypothetical protein
MKKHMKHCESQSPICSGELVRAYGVNGSEKKGLTFWICGPCAVLIRHGGSTLKECAG